MTDLAFNNQCEPNNSSGYDNESEIEICIDSREAQLQETNDLLIQENTKLKAQFDEAVKISDNMENLYVNNISLTNQVGKLSEEKDEIKRRLDISLKTISELKEKINADTRSINEERHNFNINAQKEISQLKSQHLIDEANWNKKLQEEEKIRQNSELKMSLLISSIEKLLSACNHFFDSSFSDINELTKFISDPATKKSLYKLKEKEMIESVDEAKPKFEENKEALENTSSKSLNKANAINFQLKQKIFRLQNKSQRNTAKYSKQISQLKSKFNEEKEALELQNTEIQNAKSKLEIKCKKLQSELEKIKTLKSQNENHQPTFSQFTSSSRPFSSTLYPTNSIPHNQNVNKTENQQELSELIQTAHEEITNLNEDTFQMLSKFEKESAEQKTEIKNLSQKLFQSSLEIENQKSQLSALQIVHNQSIEEIKTLRNVLHERNTNGLTSKDIQSYEKKICDQKSKISNYKRSVDSLKENLYKTQAELEQSKTDLNHLKNVHQNTLSSLDELKEQYSTATEEIIDLKRQLNLEKNEIDQNRSDIPPSAWKYPEFGTDLNVSINRTLSNMTSSLSNSSKLHLIYKTIQDYYTAVIAEKDQRISTITSDFDSEIKIISQFLKDISISIGITDATEITRLSSFQNYHLDQIKLNSVISRAKELFTSCMELQQRNDENQLKSGNELNESNQTINNMKKIIKKQNKIINNFKIKLENLFEERKNSDINNNEEISNLKEQLKEASEKLNQVSSIASSQKRQLQQVQNELSNTKETFEEELEGIEKEHQNILNQKEGEKQNIIYELKDTLVIKENQIEQLTTQNSELQNSIADLKKLIQNQRSTIESSDQNLAEIKNQIKQENEKFEKEKSQITLSYEKAIKDLTEQCNAHLIDIENLSKQLTAANQKIKKQQKCILEIKTNSEEEKNEFTVQIQDLEREKQLIKANCQTELLRERTNAATKIREEQSKIDIQLRKMYAYAANEFRLYYNISDTINEKSFQKLISQVKNALDKLVISDRNVRKIVGAQTSQSTDEAVTQAMLSK